VNYQWKNLCLIIKMLFSLAVLLSASVGALAQPTKAPTYYGEALDAFSRNC
ncbi:uncharacterized protein METZ01_LOCUS397045, partial [marine metagenome]